MRRANLLIGLYVLFVFAPNAAYADIAYAGTPRLTGVGNPDDFTNILYVNEGQPFDLSRAGGTEGVATEFNFWAKRRTGVVTPFIAEVIRANSFIIRAIGTTRVGRTDWNGTGLQQFAFSDEEQPTIEDGWVGGFMSSYPDGSSGGSPIPFANSNVQGWLTASQDRVGGPTIALDKRPRTGDFATDVNAHGLRRYQFQIGAEVFSVFDCNRDAAVSVLDANCASAESLVETLSEANLLQGDADGDGEVQFADFLTLSLNFGNPGQYTDGDFDGDGTVQFPDFLILASNFGQSATAVAAVPEPSSASLILLGAVAFMKRRRPRSLQVPLAV